jgi:hypothetical protein
MYLINRHPTVDFSQYVDLPSLMALKPYLDYAVVKSSISATPSRYFKSQFLHPTHTGISDAITHDTYQYDFIKDLKDHDQYALWLSYTEDVIYGQRSVQIAYANDWDKKHLKDHVTETANMQYWTAFTDWLNAQNIFAEYGRIVVFLNEPNGYTPIHYDSLDRTRPDEFVWISLDNRKKMFVFDNKTNRKYYLDTNIGMFDTANYHGADVSNLASWSVRVDGVFSDQFLVKSALLPHFRPPSVTK